MTPNSRGSTYMILAMAAFAVEDMFIKAAADTLAIGPILMLFGGGGMLVFMLLAKLRQQPLYHPAVLSRALLVRSAFEIVGRLFFALAIILSPLSSASAILQATPLVVVLGAALFMGERVSLLRWLAIIAGFIGVLMIVRPGVDSFNPASLFAVISTIGFAGRDLSTRAAPPVLTNLQLGIYGFLVLIICGVILQVWYGSSTSFIDSLTLEAGLQVGGAILFGVAAYNFLTNAMRTGDVSVVTPFRYTRLIFALILGVIIFNERPDIYTLTGGMIIVLSGVYILMQGRRRGATVTQA